MKFFLHCILSMNNPETSDKRLKILNASAGSGKTYSLVKEFVKLLLEDKNDPKRFAKIIAMTFTNMASLEMKTRVISALDKLSYAKPSDEEAQKYSHEIGAEIGCDPSEVNKRAKSILSNLLHSYEDFSVMTIDKFNLRLIRSFSRDLDLPSDFEVVLNEKLVIEQVVDHLLSNLGTKEKADFTKVALQYAHANIDNEEKWDFRSKLIEFTSSFSNEKQQEYLKKLIQEDLSEQRLKEIKTEIANIDAEFIALAKKLSDLHISYGDQSNFYPNKSHTSNYILKLADASQYISKSVPKNTLSACYKENGKGQFMPDEFKHAFIELNDFQTKYGSYYATLRLFVKNYYNMALLRYVSQAIDDLKREEKIIRISEFNQLISSLVQQEKAPFIYERLGMRYKNFLLDEFQDTSHLQWLNMVPLVHESLSNGHFNLIVGDPKQSIYRFKNGVAEQFVELPGIYNPNNDPDISEKSKYFQQAGYTDALNNNWRSGMKIVNFNNDFFSLLSKNLPEFAQPFYESIRQHPKSKKEGSVFIKSKKIEKDEEIDVEAELIQTIGTCLEKGFSPNDLCILTDTNKEANNWALILKSNGFKIVSAESLLVQNDQRVKLTISYLKRRNKPAQKSEMKRFAEMYFRTESDDHFRYFNSYLTIKQDKDGKSFQFFDNDKFIIDHFGMKEKFYCSYENLYDLIQQFYRTMGWSELNNPYLHHLADFAFEFDLSHGPDLSAFLNHFEEKRKSLAIQTPASDDAITVMTIHKSKGLEFPVVIIPNMDLDLKIRGTNAFLLESDGLILHTSLSANSEIDAVREYQSDELDHILTDKLNLCYVGMTRPKEKLIVFNYWKQGLGKNFHETLANMKGATEENGTIVYASGAAERSTAKKENSSQFFEATNISDNLWFPDIALSDEKRKTDRNSLLEERRFGNQFHLMMSELTGEEAIDVKVDELIKEGLIELTFRDQLIKKAESFFQNNDVKDLLQNAIEILNEQLILLDETNSRRPDKLIMKDHETIVLDYKTGIPDPKDEKQVNQYLNILEEMGTPNPRGFIYYTTREELLEIRPKT